MLTGCIKKFDEMIDELGDTEIVEKTFEITILNSVKPSSLQEKIKDRMLTTRSPDGCDENNVTWRKHVKRIQISCMISFETTQNTKTNNVQFNRNTSNQKRR